MDHTESGPWHDPELHFLDVLEQEVRRKAERSAIRHEERQHLAFSGAHGSGALPSHRRDTLEAVAAHRSLTPSPPMPVPSRTAHRRQALRGPVRIARRSLTLMALLCLVGASAYGASEVFSKSTPNPLGGKLGAFAPVASGRSGPDRWKLRLYMRGGELCRVLNVAEAESSDCGPVPSAHAVEATSQQSPSRRYVFGITGAKVLRVRVRVGHARRTLPTHAPAARLAGSDGLPAHIRYYLAALPRPEGGADPQALVEGLSGAGAPLGKPVASCLETGEPGRC